MHLVDTTVTAISPCTKLYTPQPIAGVSWPLTSTVLAPWRLSALPLGRPGQSRSARQLARALPRVVLMRGLVHMYMHTTNPAL